MELREISTRIKEANKQVLKAKRPPKKNIVFGVIAIIAILNFSLPFFYGGLDSYKCVFVNAVEMIQDSIFINLEGQALTPANFVKKF